MLIGKLQIISQGAFQPASIFELVKVNAGSEASAEVTLKRFHIGLQSVELVILGLKSFLVLLSQLLDVVGALVFIDSDETLAKEKFKALAH